MSMQPEYAERGSVPASELDTVGVFDDRFRAFLETIAESRSPLHRFCARMTGSIADGEDVMQDVLFEAYRKLDQYDDARPLRPWLFQIAHNRCIDFLRRRQVRGRAEAVLAAETPDAVQPAHPTGPALGRAIERLVVALPPKERACVLLKDVFDYSLEEIATLVDSTSGGVKSALNRARGKLARLAEVQPVLAADDPEAAELIRLYVERFNRQDWDGVRALTCADAQLRVADCFAGPLAASPYFTEYARAETPWRLEIGRLDGDVTIIVHRDQGRGMEPSGIVKLDVRDGRISRILDCSKCPWVIAAAGDVTTTTEIGSD